MAEAKICAVDGCGKLSSQRGMCRAHHRRWWKHGDPLAGGPFRERKFGRCIVDACQMAAVTKRLCRNHYERLRRWGDPQGGRAGDGEPKHWLVDHCAFAADECLIYPFARKDTGYGHFQEDGKEIYAHRFMCELVHGAPPSDGYETAHSCGQGHEGCVSPRHLRWATRKENLADRQQHGTLNIGTLNGSSILNEDQVRHIRRLLGTIPQTEIAEQFGVSRGAISDISRGKNWSWLT